MISSTQVLTLREKRRLSVFENRALRRIFGPNRNKLTGVWENFIMRSSMICTPHPLVCGLQNREEWNGRDM
jgi:hypothetical protein